MERGFQAEGEEHTKTLSAKKIYSFKTVVPKPKTSETCWARMKFSLINVEMKTKLLSFYKDKVIQF